MLACIGVCGCYFDDVACLVFCAFLIDHLKCKQNFRHDFYQEHNISATKFHSALYLGVRNGTEFHRNNDTFHSISQFDAWQLWILYNPIGIFEILQNSFLHTIFSCESFICCIIHQSHELVDFRTARTSITNFESTQMSLQCRYNMLFQWSIEIDSHSQILLHVLEQINQIVIPLRERFVVDVHIKKRYIAKDHTLEKTQPQFVEIAQIFTSPFCWQKE